MFLNTIILFLSINIPPFDMNKDFSLFWCNTHNSFKDLPRVIECFIGYGLKHVKWFSNSLMMMICSSAILSVGSGHCDDLTVRMKNWRRVESSGRKMLFASLLLRLTFLQRILLYYNADVQFNFLCFISLISKNSEVAGCQTS